jgi:hypothetical protein
VDGRTFFKATFEKDVEKGKEILVRYGYDTKWETHANWATVAQNN